jgi:uncharacterized phage-associated protein
MLVSREREKLINAMIYFVRNTKHCHTLKLFKLLNFLDFEHFRQTGRPVTGQRYVAWKQGPAPNALWHELEQGGGDDLKQAIALIAHKDDVTGKTLRREMRPKTDFNSKIFSKRELAIMQRLAEFFLELKGEDMTEFSHDRKLPWKKVFGRGEGEGKEIPLELSLDAKPIIEDAPTIDKDELEYRRTLFAGLR